jgi:teichuronic acid biosynthesis glycosyltransferase TuaH
MEHKMIKNRDIVIFGFQPWNVDIGSNSRDMALEMSKYNRVLYINRALDRAFAYKNRKNAEIKSSLNKIREGKDEIVQVAPQIWLHNPGVMLESINWIPSAFIFDKLNRINSWRLAKQINSAIAALDFRDVILINDNDFIRGRYLAEMVHCKEYIFYIRDYMLGVGYFKRHGARLEAGTMKEADLVVANSQYLANYSSKFNPKSFDIGQGCDLTKYGVSSTIMPADLSTIKKPIIGYVGFISAWRIDLKIIEHLAAELPDCRIVLIGPDDLSDHGHKLRRFKNVHFLGIKPQEVLSDYIYYFDVCINPQILNEVTIGNYPRKVDEYLALGKPVVATRTLGMKLFEPFTYLCDTKEEYVQTVRRILGNPEKYMSEEEKNRRVEFVFSHTWEDCVGRLGDAYYSVKDAGDGTTGK